VILPPVVDNTYRGHKAALVLFGIVLLLRTMMGVNMIFNGATVASGADGIPLGAYPTAAAHTIVTLFSLMGLTHLVFCAIGWLALFRYRSVVPFLFALFLTEHLSRRLIVHLLPIARRGDSPASMITYALLALMAVGLGLSLWRRRELGAS
jgi:hypothetical protein